jgi:type II secretory pathway component PulF
MPEFAFNANDRHGSLVEGTVNAPDMSAAAEQVRAMGYAPLRIQLIESASVPAAVGVSQFSPYGASGVGTGAPAPVDLTQAFPLETPQPLVPQTENAQATVQRMERLEPWERGGTIPQAETPPPALTINHNGIPIPAPRAPQSAPEWNRPVVRTPYGAGADTNKPFAQRFKETLIYPIYAGVVIKDLAPFYRQFAAMINAGLPLYQALSALEANTANPKLKEIARAGQAQVQAGGKFSEVMASYPWIFAPMQIELVRAAEKGGMLDKTLVEIAEYVEHEIEIRRLVSRETLYPKITLFMAFVILGRPGFGGGMPAVASLVVGSMGKMEYTAANYLMDTVGFLAMWIVPIMALVALFRLSLFNVPGVREKYDTIKMAIPGLGGLVRMFAMAKFLRTFAALFRAGFSIPASLEIAGDACGNGVIGATAKRAIPRVERGEFLSDVLSSYGVFPPIAYNMMRTGETSGNLDAMLGKTADFFEDEAKTKSHQTAIAFGVLVFLLVALLVGRAIIGQYMSYGAGIGNAASGE